MGLKIFIWSVGEINWLKLNIIKNLNNVITSDTFGNPTPLPQQPHPLLQYYYLLQLQNIKQELGQKSAYLELSSDSKTYTRNHKLLIHLMLHLYKLLVSIFLNLIANPR